MSRICESNAAVGELRVVEAHADVRGVVDVLGRLRHTDADGGDGLRAQREAAVEHEHARGGDHGRAAAARRAQGDDPPLAVDQVVGLRELLDVVGRIGDEQAARGVDQRVALGTGRVTSRSIACSSSSSRA